MKQAAKGAAVFLDRDGTLIREVHYLSSIEQLEILPGVPAALRRLSAHGFRLIMVTNQSAIARGALSEAGLAEIHAELVARLSQAGARLDGIYYCPHHPVDGLGDYRIACDCRKPKTGMIRRAAVEFGLDPALSYVVGDQWIDMELAEAVGATGLWVGHADATSQRAAPVKFSSVADLAAAADWIIERLGAPAHGRESA
jgi:D-glycero-D-manno-heptose 1,7-bisphosphate phosphatase